MIRTTFLLILLTVLASCSKLNVPRVLLPISPKTPVNYTLEISDGGCYTWSSSRPEAVKVIPIQDGDACSQMAVVSSTGSSSHKTSAIILAKEQSTGEVFRCDVIVNHISSIQIAMKTHELFIEDAPEEFYARALDDQGNEFSSVDGLIFRWSFEGHSTDVDSTNEPVLQWVKFADSSYTVMPSIATLETLGYQGHVILIEGLRTGSAIVSVRLEDESFKSVPTCAVNIIVVANLVLDPPEVYLLPGSTIAIQLSQIRQGRAEVIPLPSSQYYLEIDDAEVGSILESSGSVQALQLGTTDVRLRDRNMKDPTTGHTPFITVHVVHPHRLSLALLPERSWATTLNLEHAIQVELFDEHGNFIQPNDHLFVQVDVPEAFQVAHSSTNGTHHQGVTIKTGVHKVKASLRSLRLADGQETQLVPELKTSADLEVFESVSVTPARQILAWDPLTQPRYEVKFTASGGAKSLHHFTSSNTSFAAVAQSGVAKTQGLGSCSISACISKYPHIRGDAKLYVLPAITMAIIPDIVEVEEGNIVNVPVGMTTRLPNGVESAFDDCSQVSLGMELSDQKNFAIDTTQESAAPSKGCRSIQVHASGIAVTKLSLTLAIDDEFITDSLILSSYRKLSRLEPSSGETVLALGSSRLLVFEGGPLPWVNKPSSHYRKVVVVNETVAAVDQLLPVIDSRHVHKDVYQVKVTCSQIGETRVEYRVGNVATSTNANPVEALTYISVFCVHPDRIYLRPEIRLPDETKTPCTLDRTTQRTAAQSYLDLTVITVVEDEKGRKLDNFSSLELAWSLSQPQLGQLKSLDGVFLETKQVNGYSVLGQSYQLLHPVGDIGPLDVNVKIVGYKKAALEDLKLSSTQPMLLDEFPSFGEEEASEYSKLSHSVGLILVNDVEVDPGKHSLYNHQNNKLSLRLVGGSGSFYVEYQPKSVARVYYNELNRSLSVIPLTNGELKITVSDLCLWSRKPATSFIQVVGLSRIELEVADKIEQGSSVAMSVHLFDTLGQSLDASVLPFIQLQPVLGSSIVTVKAVSGTEHTVEGVALGETTISFSAADVKSSVVHVIVFAPLKLSPRNVTLVLGATLQVITSGGPQLDAAVEVTYTLENEDVATCTSNGIINAIQLGHSKLVARAVGVDRLTGQQRIYSQDQVDIHVIRLSGIRIVTPLTRVRRDTEIPVYIMGLDENETPFAFATCQPPLHVEWLLSDHQSGQLLSPLRHTGLDSLPDSSQFTARFRALQAGHSSLKVIIRATQSDSGQLSQDELVDEVSIQVYESLQLVNPSKTSGHFLLMMPNTQLDLKTNLDSSASLDYVVEAATSVVVPDSKGTIRSDTSLGQSALILTAVNSHGVSQSFNVLVEVRSVSYMMLTASAVLNTEPSVRMLTIPRGFELDFHLSYFDALGRAFHGVRNQLNFRPSRFDLMRVNYDSDNSSLTVHADKVGQTLLHISDDFNPGLNEYIRFDVADVIQPSQATFLVGDVICFSTPVLSTIGSKGKWMADSKLLDIDPETGIALALGVGETEVFYTLSDKQVTSIEVRINASSHLDIESSEHQFVTDTRRSVIPLSFRKTGSNLVGDSCSTEDVTQFLRYKNLPLSCQVSFTVENDVKVDDVLSARVEFDAKSGSYQCIIKPIAMISTASSSIIETDVLLKAQYAGVVTAQVSLPFEPSFHVLTGQVHLSDVQPNAHIIIVGKPNVLQQLEYTASDTSSLTVYSAQYLSPTNVKIPIRFNPGYDNEGSLVVTIRSPMTSQHMDVSVIVKLLGDNVKCTVPSASWFTLISSLLHFSQEWALSLLSLLGTFAAIYIGYRALFGSSYRSTSDPVVFLSSGSNTETAYSSPFIKRGPQLWSVNAEHDSPLHHSGFYSHSSSPTTSPSRFNRQHSPF